MLRDASCPPGGSILVAQRIQTMTPDKVHPPEGTETISWEFEGVGLRVQDRMDFTGEAEPPLTRLKRRFTFGAFVTSLKKREAIGHHFPPAPAPAPCVHPSVGEACLLSRANPSTYAGPPPLAFLDPLPSEPRLSPPLLGHSHQHMNILQCPHHPLDPTSPPATT